MCSCCFSVGTGPRPPDCFCCCFFVHRTGVNFSAPLGQPFQCHDPPIVIVSLQSQRQPSISKHCAMPKNRIKLATPADIKQQLAANNLLRGERPETILAIKFDAANDNAALYTNPQDFSEFIKLANRGRHSHFAGVQYLQVWVMLRRSCSQASARCLAVQ